MNASLKPTTLVTYPPPLCIDTHTTDRKAEQQRSTVTRILRKHSAWLMPLQYWYVVLTTKNYRNMLTEKSTVEPLYKDVRFWVVLISFLLMIGLGIVQFNY